MPAADQGAREEVLARIRTALGHPGHGAPAHAAPQSAPSESGAAGPGEPPPVPGQTVPPTYRTGGGPGTAGLTGLLAERLADYGCTVHRITPGELAATAATALTQRGARHVIVPVGLPLPDQLDLAGLADLAGTPGLPEGTEIVTDDGRPAAALDAFDAVITGAAVAIAETGTIILDGSPGQGRRALTLIPDYHLCILHTSQIVALVPDALERLSPGRPLTWISGPSATSDIELDRVQGVHGPRTLEVILIEPPDMPQR